MTIAVEHLVKISFRKLKNSFTEVRHFQLKKFVPCSLSLIINFPRSYPSLFLLVNGIAPTFLWRRLIYKR